MCLVGVYCIAVYRIVSIVFVLAWGRGGGAGCASDTSPSSSLTSGLGSGLGSGLSSVLDTVFKVSLAEGAGAQDQPCNGIVTEVKLVFHSVVLRCAGPYRIALWCIVLYCCILG